MGAHSLITVYIFYLHDVLIYLAYKYFQYDVRIYLLTYTVSDGCFCLPRLTKIMFLDSYYFCLLTGSGSQQLGSRLHSTTCSVRVLTCFLVVFSQEVVLTNSGQRSAFVRASAFYDLPCTRVVEAGRVAVEPNCFVLPPGASRRLIVAVSPSLRDVQLVAERKEVTVRHTDIYTHIHTDTYIHIIIFTHMYIQSETYSWSPRGKS